MHYVIWVWVLVACLSVPTWAQDSAVLNSPTLGKLVCIPGGTFQMGSPSAEAGRASDETQHSVTVSRFCMMESEVTQGAYQAVVGSNPSVADYKGVSLLGSTLPVQNVSWYDAVAYANAVSVKEGLTPAYTINGTDIQWNTNANGYRLPTEAEWEYAARGGKTTVYAGTSSVEDVCRYGNVNNPSSKAKFGWDWAAFPCEDNSLAVAPIKSFQPNGYTLYDLTGNVWEWVWDTYGPYSTSGNTFKADSLENPQGNASGSYRVFRGGGWGYNPGGARVALRFNVTPSYRYGALGFRLSRTNP